MAAVTLSNSTLKRIEESSLDVSRILRSDAATWLPLVTDTERYDKLIAELVRHCGDLRGKKILEVGCGYGVMLVHAIRTYGLDAHGVEPPRSQFEGRYEIAQQVLRENRLASGRIASGVGEKIPFPDASFDIVYSFQVLEHVQDPLQVLRESWRVLRPGGILYVNAPNYNTFFEGHYNIFWIPGMPKWLSKLYLRLLGRDPRYIHHINSLNEALLRKWLELATGKQVEGDLGAGDWAERMTHSRVHRFTNPNISRLLNLASGTGLLPLAVRLGRHLKWQDVMRVAIRKA